jgi:hypothetical protein
MRPKLLQLKLLQLKLLQLKRLRLKPLPRRVKAVERREPTWPSSQRGAIAL